MRWMCMRVHSQVSLRLMNEKGLNAAVIGEASREGGRDGETE